MPISFSKLSGALLLSILIIPATVVWSAEFKEFYYKKFKIKNHPTHVRLLYAVIVTVLALIGFFLLYKFAGFFEKRKHEHHHVHTDV